MISMLQRQLWLRPGVRLIASENSPEPHPKAIRRKHPFVSLGTGKKKPGLAGLLSEQKIKRAR